MNKNRRIITVFLILLIAMLCVYTSSCLQIYRNEEQEKIYIEDYFIEGKDIKGNEISVYEKLCGKVPVESSIESNTEKKYKKTELPKDADCIIYIPSIELEKIVYNGADRYKYLEEYKLVTATENMKYNYGRNYVICGHSSQLYGHSLNRIKDVSVNDTVYIMQESNVDQYKVSSITYEEMEDTNRFCEQNDNRQITILSCAKYMGKNKYIVIKCIQ